MTSFGLLGLGLNPRVGVIRGDVILRDVISFHNSTKDAILEKICITMVAELPHNAAAAIV